MPLPPENPQNFDKVNYVVEAWSRPCRAPWYIYVQTLKPAALEAFIVLISFGWADVVRGRLRPRGLGRRTGKRKGRWNPLRPRFPETGNTLGKNIPFAEQLDDFVKWGTATRFLWRIDNLMQAGLFMWLVVDVAEDFAFNWTSLLYKSYWCRASDLGSFSYRTLGWGPIPNDVWKLAGFFIEDYEFTPPEWFFNHGGSGPNGCTVAAAMKVEQRLPFAPPTGFKVVVWNVDANKPFQDYELDELPASGSGSSSTSVSVPPNTSFEVRAYMTGTSWASYGEGVVMAIENEP